MHQPFFEDYCRTNI